MLEVKKKSMETMLRHGPTCCVTKVNAGRPDSPAVKASALYSQHKHSPATNTKTTVICPYLIREGKRMLNILQPTDYVMHQQV